MSVPILIAPQPFGPHGVCLALGLFDGVHLGHQHVVRQAKIDARARGAATVVATFDPHPLAVVRPDKAPRLLQSLAQRLASLEAQGADAVLVLRFDAARGWGSKVATTVAAPRARASIFACRTTC